MRRYCESFAEHLAVAPMSDFIEQVGHFFDRFGFRRNLGRIWATLYLAPDPLSQAEIAVLLDLSSGLVSSSLKELEHWRAVRVAPMRGSRATHYEAEDQLLRTVAAILARRELEAVRRLRDAAAEVRVAYSPARHGPELTARLAAVEHVCDLYEALAGAIGTMARLPIGIVEQAARALKLTKILERASGPARIARRRHEP
jgi:DNA-binding transcriptional regulator GbsR (MarR family)